MIIKQVELENYRSHSNTSIEFSKGVNLILGKNGRGKSSILEAISTVMFNAKDRNGKENGKNYIKFGEKYAKVNINFIANDGREYSLKTDFFEKKPKKQILEDSVGNIYDGDISEKLEELCGIKRTFKDIYENIVIAKQNEFINIFKAKPKDREEIFNKIFNTQVYKEMYDSFLKEAIDKYKFEKDSLNSKINSLKENMEDKEEVLILLENEEKLKDELKNNFNEIMKSMNNFTNEINKYDTTKLELKNLISKINDEEEKIKKYISFLKESIAEAKQAKKSKKIVQETEKYYFEYLEVEKKLKTTRKDLETLEDEEKLNIQYKHNIEKLKINNENLKIEIENLEKNENKNSLVKENLENEVAELEIKEKELNFKLKEYANLLIKLENLENIKNKKEEIKLKKIAEINFLKKDLDSKKDFFEKIDLDKIEKKLFYFSEIEKELENLSKQKIINETEIKTLKKSNKELENKICPFLNENCENLKDKKIDDYFSTKILTKTLDLEKIRNDIEEKNQILIEKLAFENEKKEYFNLEKEINNLLLSLKEEEINLKKIEFELEVQNKDIRNILENSKILNSLMLRENKKEAEVELKNLNLDEKRKNLKEISEDLELEKRKILKSQDLLKNNLEKIEDFSKKIKIDVDKNIKILKTEKENLETRLNILKSPYNEYLKNNKLAEDLELLINKVKRTINEIYSLRKNKSSLKEKSYVLNSQIKNIKIDELKKKYDVTQGKLNEINKIMGSSQEKIENYHKILEKIAIQEEREKALFFKLKKIENKLNKGTLIRNEVGQMGRAISKYMLNGIANNASLNFNKITGRSERIEWSNEEKDKYAVYLVGQDKKIAFEQLSGGEQVSVAIAIRGTMTEYFTNSKFMILDEPTNNLDTERKKLLAEYMGEILNSLDQSIIVTHDDTFREMAEKIIEL